MEIVLGFHLTPVPRWGFSVGETIFTQFDINFGHITCYVNESDVSLFGVEVLRCNQLTKKMAAIFLFPVLRSGNIF